MSPSSLTLLSRLLGILRALHWSHWTSHWKVQGDPQYGDHLLFDRLYTGIEENIDALGEKIVAYYGPKAFEDTVLLAYSAQFLGHFPLKDDGPTALYERALAMEEQLQVELRGTYQDLKGTGDLSLGLDDFLMSLANDHESHLYLLRQRLR